MACFLIENIPPKEYNIIKWFKGSFDEKIKEILKMSIFLAVLI